MLAYGKETNREKHFKHGYDDYIIKPINKKNTKTSSKKTVNKKTNIIDEDKPTENSMSLNDMLEAGEEYEFSLEDDENGEELF